MNLFLRDAAWPLRVAKRQGCEPRPKETAIFKYFVKLKTQGEESHGPEDN
jgi:hypothetical protein